MSAPKSEWMAGAEDAARKLFKSMELVTGEDIRFALIKAGYPEPNHPNAWGTFTLRLTRGASPFLVDSGERTAMRADRSNGRKTPVYFVQA